jgi:hypothetical protein
VGGALLYIDIDDFKEFTTPTATATATMCCA